jgi:hypothetical protein
MTWREATIEGLTRVSLQYRSNAFTRMDRLGRCFIVAFGLLGTAFIRHSLPLRNHEV